MAYKNPHITGQYNPVYNQTKQGFDRCSNAYCTVQAPELANLQRICSKSKSWEKNSGPVAWTAH